MICVIPARGGSKRLPGKNIKELDGIPVIAFAMGAAEQSGLFDAIYVSTEDSEIEKVSRKYGAEVHHRPARLAEDDVTDVQVIEHLLKEFDTDYLCYLYPTAALTTPEQLIRGLDTCRALGGKIGCMVKRVKGFTFATDVRAGDWTANRYDDAGQFYWIRGGDPIEDRGYIELDPLECQDVNTAEDWAMLEAKWRVRK